MSLVVFRRVDSTYMKIALRTYRPRLQKENAGKSSYSLWILDVCPFPSVSFLFHFPLLSPPGSRINVVATARRSRRLLTVLSGIDKADNVTTPAHLGSSTQGNTKSSLRKSTTVNHWLSPLLTPPSPDFDRSVGGW